jgi:DNA-directed RNA polymerase specialized sigma24 family protein
MDSDIFDGFYEKYWQQVFTSAVKRLGNTEKAVKVTQDAFFQLWIKRNNISEAEVTAFLLAAVRDEIFTLMEKECIYIEEPGKLFELIPLPGAN